MFLNEATWYFASTLLLLSFHLSHVVASEYVVELVKDINTQYKMDSDLSSLFVHNGKGFFRATDGVHGRELWVTNGTEEGTYMVKDISPNDSRDGVDDDNDTFSRVGYGFVPVPLSKKDNSEKIIFKTSGVKLWVSDGTEDGTKMLQDFNTDRSTKPYSVSFKDRAYFLADDGVHGIQPWVTDGTENGTEMFMEIVGSGEVIMVTIGNNLAFLSSNAVYFSDGTPEGTTRSDSIDSIGEVGSWRRITNLNDKVLFSAMSSTQLWVTDGKGNDSTLLFYQFSEGRIFEKFLCCAPTLGSKALMLVVSNDINRTNEVWVTDGTSEGTRYLKNLDVNLPVHYNPSTTNTLFFADDGIHGEELWETDGTPEGTILFKEFTAGTLGIRHYGGTFYKPRDEENYYGDVFFFIEGMYSTDLWQSDGTLSGTKSIHQFYDLSTTTIVRLNDNTYIFEAEGNEATGKELWKISNVKPSCATSMKGYHEIVLVMWCFICIYSLYR